jgi:peptide chain release factor 1
MPDAETQLKDIRQKIAETQELLKDPDENQEFFLLAKEEIEKLKQKEQFLIKEIEINEKEKAKFSSVIMEIRPGTGGDEAALFAGDLFNMYSRYAQTQNWEQKILDSKKTELNGIKEIVFEVKGENVYSRLKNEGGVHRVQRIPKTEKMGRIHTSTASVAVLLKPKKTEIEINSKDLRIDIFKSSGAGGQNVNKRLTAIRITHLPTNIVVSSQTERNQLRNKENAMAILEARVLEKKQSEEAQAIGGNRKAQIGSAMRAEKIRTYNFPQNRLTDHRVKKSWHNLEEIMQGKLDKVLSALGESNI